MTQGDPEGKEVIAFQEVSISIVGFLETEGKYVILLYYGSPGAGNPLAGWERATTLMKLNPSRQ